MDRRRFAPSPEGLEGRELLSLFGGKTPATSTAATIESLPDNVKQKELRIEHLPFFLQQLEKKRYLPPATVQSIQTDLSGVVGVLHAPPAKQVDGFNRSLRHLFVLKNLSADNAKILNHGFGVVLAGAGATPTQVLDLKQDLNSLAVVDSKSIDGSQLAANDFTLILQTALAVGRPILAPSAPALAARDGVRVHNGLGGLTHNHTPSLVGTYLAGVAKEQSTVIQIVDDGGNVLGYGPLDKNGKYDVKVINPLEDGTYKLQVRALEAPGFLSNPSAVFVLKVSTKPSKVAAQTLSPPGGPLGLNGR